MIRNLKIVKSKYSPSNVNGTMWVTGNKIQVFNKGTWGSNSPQEEPVIPPTPDIPDVEEPKLIHMIIYYSYFNGMSNMTFEEWCNSSYNNSSADAQMFVLYCKDDSPYVWVDEYDWASGRPGMGYLEIIGTYHIGINGSRILKTDLIKELDYSETFPTL